MPQLLVSVRNAKEARTAALAGVSLIDFKDPTRGSLGMASLEKIRESLPEIHKIDESIQISCACGEVVETVANPTASETLSGINFLKMGLSHLANHNNWREVWVQRREQINKSFLNENSTRWVAVSYLDQTHAQSPKHQEVINAAVETNCSGVLFDTYDKSSGRLFDWIDESQLISLCEQIHATGMFCAVAGRLRLTDVQRLADSPIDVVAVRSAACENENRTACVSTEKILKLLKTLDSNSVATKTSSRQLLRESTL